MREYFDNAPSIHFERAWSSAERNRAYCLKSVVEVDKLPDTLTDEYRVASYEYGELPRRGQRNDMRYGARRRLTLQDIQDPVLGHRRDFNLFRDQIRGRFFLQERRLAMVLRIVRSEREEQATREGLMLSHFTSAIQDRDEKMIEIHDILRRLRQELEEIKDRQAHLHAHLTQITGEV